MTSSDEIGLGGRKSRIHINALGAAHGGIVRVLECVAQELACEGEVLLWQAPRDLAPLSGVQIASWQRRSRFASVLMCLAPRRRQKADLRIDIAPALHSGLSSRRRLVVVHDLAFLHDGLEYVSTTQRTYRRLVTHRSVRRSQRIVAVSSQTAAELRRFMVDDGIDLRVLPLPVTHISGGIDLATTRTPRQGSNIRVLAICQGPNKGIDTMLQMASSRSDVTLRIVSNRRFVDQVRVSSAFPADLESAGRVEFLYGLDDSALREEYLKADVFCMPSRYEGYGLPVAEALLLATPTVTSDLEVLAETSRGYAVRAQGWGVDAFSSAVDEALGVGQSHWQAAARVFRDWTWRHWVDAALS